MFKSSHRSPLSIDIETEKCAATNQIYRAASTDQLISWVNLSVAKKCLPNVNTCRAFRGNCPIKVELYIYPLL